jgi:OPA family sugar phosphate sensor protein UhpC-like MFS transporter
MLIGLCGAEIVSKKSVGASQGILGLVSYSGAAAAGVPLAFMQHRFGWDGYFALLAAACLAAVALLLPLVNARSQAQIEAANGQAKA